MNKESTHRSDELKDLGWSNEDISRYIELWDYRQRWGAINLEREDRLFLRKVESALPVISNAKPSIKKPIQEKSYYRRLSFYIETMNLAESELKIPTGGRGVWPILLEEELRALDYYQPVLGLPDTIKAKAFEAFREDIISRFLMNKSNVVETFNFDFNSPLEELKAKKATSWRPLREVTSKENTYPVLKLSEINEFRKKVREESLPLIRETLPSLVDTAKPVPPDDWVQQ